MIRKRGGHAADYIIDYLRKPLNSYWSVRDGEDFRQPFGTLPGRKVMIINEYAGAQAFSLEPGNWHGKWGQACDLRI